MQEKSDALEFESAARIRDQIQAVEKTLEKQRMVAHWGGDQDIFGLYREGGFIEVQVLLVRQGKLTGNQSYSLEDLEFPDEEVMGALLTQFYQGQRFIPDEILLPVELEDRAAREDYLGRAQGQTDGDPLSAAGRQATLGRNGRSRMRARVLPTATIRKRRARRCCASCKASCV